MRKIALLVVRGGGIRMGKLERGLIYGVMAVSFIICLVIGGRRIVSEGKAQGVRIGIRYEDVLHMAFQQNKDVRELLIRYKEAGATSLLIKENTLLPEREGAVDNEVKQGHVRVLRGYEENNFSKTIGQVKVPFTYIVTEDRTIANRIVENLERKGIFVDHFVVAGEEYIEIREEEILTNVGVGFSEEAIVLGEELGYEIWPGIRSWTEGVRNKGKKGEEKLGAIPGNGPLYFLGDSIPGYSSLEVVELVARRGVFFREFIAHKQEGFNTLVAQVYKKNNNYPVIREFGDDNLKSFSTLETLSRYKLALIERKNRAFLFNMPQGPVSKSKGEKDLEELIKTFKEEAQKAGYLIATEQNHYELEEGLGIGGRWVSSFLAGLGAIGFFVLLMKDLNKKHLGYGGALIGIIGYGLLLSVKFELAIKLMALFGAIISPVYAVSHSMKSEKRNYKETLVTFLKVCLISLGGGLTIVGVLSRSSYSLGVDRFTGVKLAYLLPILAVIGIALYKNKESESQSIRQILHHKVTYLALGVIGLLSVFFLIYALRSGNTTEVPYFEKVIRDALTHFLGVRPRTKEFLIGYPFLIVALYWGNHEKYLPLVALGTIGPVSLVNTYAHIHTPFLISLLRSSYGIILGIVIGFVLLLAINRTVNYVQKNRK